MDPAAATLLIGIAVKISRSDGRVHSATVKTVNSTKSTVHVEWTEKEVTKGKEVDLSDISRLNADLLEYLQGPKQAGPSTASAPSPARVPKAEQKSELPKKSSKIRAPSEIPRRMTTRQTCLFRPPTVSSTGLNPTDDAQEQLSSTIPRPLGLPSYPRRQVAKPPSPLLPAVEAVSESEASKCAAAPTNQRLSRVPEVNKVTNKRLSMITKIPETQTKKGKFGDMNRPNKQFYQMIEEYRETVEKVPLSLSDPVETAKKEIDVVTIPGNGVLLFHEPKQKVDLTKYLDNQHFHFDYSFDEDASNDLVYRFTAKPLVKTIFEGGRATCFAYAQDVFTLLQQKRHTDLCPYVTFFEIYNGKVFDLLNKKAKLRVLEDENQQVQVVGLLEMPVSSVEDVIKLIEKGSACRTSGQTFANATSSRSHAVLQVILRRHKLLHGKFSLVDLAGNERGTDVSSNDRQTMVETAEINRSLLALKECIRSLGQNSEHIPFRMSKLTQVLRDSFIGENSRTCMWLNLVTHSFLFLAGRVKELNGLSKETAQNARLTEESDEGSSSLEEEAIPAELEVVAQLSELEERFYEDLQHGNEIARAMEHSSYDPISGLPEIDAYMERLQGSYHTLRSAIEALKARSPNLA
ncbi:Kinesin-like protein KIF2C [Bagarius yarrelli]|uniref:Kinesin-like protein n=1 Tax=Bagarius yarrelli TaxID=175774 RepID=A0A556U2X6_BAGYA|nr:Kinesin-like protein KIF2C [Bagarius yarrelli]